MTEVNKELFKEYRDLGAQIEELKERKSVLAEQITGTMNKLGTDQVKSDFGTFYFRTTRRWSYPAYVQTVEDKLKDEKKRAQESGDATCAETQSLSFRSKEEAE